MKKSFLRCSPSLFWLALCGLLPAPGGHAGPLPSPAWSKTFSLGGAALISGSAVVDPAGNLITVYGGKVRSISAAGDLIWERSAGMRSVKAITTDSTGNIYLTGDIWETPATAADLAVTKLASNGDVLWTRAAGNPGVMDGGFTIVVDSLGGIYAAGFSTGTSVDLFVAKYDSGGTAQWTRRFNGSADLEDRASALVALPGGGVAVTGITRNPAEQFVTIRYSPGGTGQWVAYYDAPGETEDLPCGIVRTSDGGLAVAGASGNRYIATVKYSAGGTQLWVHRADLGAGYNICTASKIVAGADGGATVFGSVQDFSPGTASFSLVSITPGGGTSFSSVLRSIPSGYAGASSMAEIPGGGWLAAAGRSSYTSSYTGIHARLTCVDAAGGGLAHLDWPLPLATSDITCDTVVSGADGSMWAVATDRGALYVKRFGAVVSAAPVVVTTGFDTLQSSSVRLKGTVNPNSAPATYYYQYGLTTAYGSTTPSRSLPSWAGVLDASEPAVPVIPGTTYHFRLVAGNSGGTREGADASFTVPASAWQVWIVNAFGSLEAPGSGALDDPDHDGLNNLTEYTFGSSPTASGQPAGLPAMNLWESPDSGLTFPSIVYYPDPARTDVVITPVVSNDLTSWTPSGVTVFSLPGGGKRAVAQGFQHFIRLQLTLP